MSKSFRPIEAQVLEGLRGAQAPMSIGELARELGLDQSPVAGAVTTLADAGLVQVDEQVETSLKLGAKGKAFAAGGFPERVVARALALLGGTASLQQIAEKAGLENKDVGGSLRWLAARGWASKSGAELTTGKTWPAEGEPDLQADEALVAQLAAADGGIDEAALHAQGTELDAALKLVEKRPGVIERKERRVRSAQLTDQGRALVESGVDARDERTELTTDLLVSGRWKEVSFRAYDISLPGPRPQIGKRHPFRRILDATRRAFLDMGFAETRSPWVESAFWDFDALFQPQDHPARDMQDTFYVGRPRTCRLPDAKIVDAVRRTHEDGGETGSRGWRYKFDAGLSERAVLRTHTTAATIRELADDPVPPRKVFCVGPVFRRETIDYKHLPVFHQVDGIVVDENASFATLLTLLSTFYEKMGFDKIQFRPAFFPYTEPSVEVFVWMESRNDWVEMGGAGVFRPEVTEPLGCKDPVLAWGLGLERLAMFRFNLKDIREIYLSHIDWLEEVPLCRS